MKLQFTSLICLMFLLFTVAIVCAHETGEEHIEPDSVQQLHNMEDQIENQRSYQTDWTVISPFHYFFQGSWMIGIIVIIAWLLFLRAFYVLALLIIHRASI